MAIKINNQNVVDNNKDFYGRDATFNGTNGVILPGGLMSERPASPVNGTLRRMQSMVDGRAYVEYYSSYENEWHRLADTDYVYNQIQAYDTFNGATFAKAGPGLGTSYLTPFAHRNRVINGNFAIHNRGSNATASGQYPADRTYVNYAGTNGNSYSTFGNVASLEMVDEFYPYHYFIRTQGATGNTGVGYVHIIEADNSYDLANRPVTVSFWMWQQSGTDITATCNLYCPNAVNGGAISGTINADAMSQTFNLTIPTSKWSKHSFTANLIGAGLSPGTGPGNGLIISISLPGLLSTQYYGLAQLQLESGTIATPFEKRPHGLEIELCARYFQIVSHVARTDSRHSTVPFRVPMHHTPTIAYVRFDAGTGATFINYNSNSPSGQVTGIYQETNHSVNSQCDIVLDSEID